MSTTPIQSKSFWTSQQSFQEKIQHMDDELFKNPDNQPALSGNLLQKKYRKRLRIYPDDLGEIRTLEQLLGIIYYDAQDKNLLDHPVSSDQVKSFLDFVFSIFEFQKAVLSADSAGNFIEGIFRSALSSYNLSALVNDVSSVQYPIDPKQQVEMRKAQLSDKARELLATLLANEEAVIQFLYACPSASETLSGQTLYQLSEKHLKVAHLILQTPSLANKLYQFKDDATYFLSEKHTHDFWLANQVLHSKKAGFPRVNVQDDKHEKLQVLLLERDKFEQQETVLLEKLSFLRSYHLALNRKFLKKPIQEQKTEEKAQGQVQDLQIDKLIEELQQKLQGIGYIFDYKQPLSVLKDNTQQEIQSLSAQLKQTHAQQDELLAKFRTRHMLDLSKLQHADPSVPGQLKRAPSSEALDVFFKAWNTQGEQLFNPQACWDNFVALQAMAPRYSQLLDQPHLESFIIAAGNDRNKLKAVINYFIKYNKDILLFSELLKKASIEEAEMQKRYWMLKKQTETIVDHILEQKTEVKDDKKNIISTREQQAVTILCGHLIGGKFLLNTSDNQEIFPLISSGDMGIYKQIFGNNPERLEEFVRQLTKPLKYLEQQGWLQEGHLVQLTPMLCQHTNVSSKELKNYLTKGEPGKRPLDQIRSYLTTSEAPHEEKNNDVKLIDSLSNKDYFFLSLLKDNRVRGWLNLSCDEMLTAVSLSNYHPLVCRQLATGRELYDKFQKWNASTQEKENFKQTIITRSVYFKTCFEINEDITNTDGGIFGCYETRVQNYLKDYIRKINQFDQTKCELIAAHDRYWQHIAVSPANKGWLFGLIGKRTQEQVDQEERALARKSRHFAAKIYSKEKYTAQQLIQLYDEKFNSSQDVEIRAMIEERLLREQMSEPAAKQLLGEVLFRFDSCQLTFFKKLVEKLFYDLRASAHFKNVRSKDPMLGYNFFAAKANQNKPIKNSNTINGHSKSSVNKIDPGDFAMLMQCCGFLQLNTADLTSEQFNKSCQDFLNQETESKGLKDSQSAIHQFYNSVVTNIQEILSVNLLEYIHHAQSNGHKYTNIYKKGNLDRLKLENDLDGKIEPARTIEPENKNQNGLLSTALVTDIQPLQSSNGNYKANIAALRKQIEESEEKQRQLMVYQWARKNEDPKCERHNKAFYYGYWCGMLDLPYQSWRDLTAKHVGSAYRLTAAPNHPDLHLGDVKDGPVDPKEREEAIKKLKKYCEDKAKKNMGRRDFDKVLLLPKESKIAKFKQGVVTLQKDKDYITAYWQLDGQTHSKTIELGKRVDILNRFNCKEQQIEDEAFVNAITNIFGLSLGETEFTKILKEAEPEDIRKGIFNYQNNARDGLITLLSSKMFEKFNSEEESWMAEGYNTAKSQLSCMNYHIDMCKKMLLISKYEEITKVAKAEVEVARRQEKELTRKMEELKTQLDIEKKENEVRRKMIPIIKSKYDEFNAFYSRDMNLKKQGVNREQYNQFFLQMYSPLAEVKKLLKEVSLTNLDIDNLEIKLLQEKAAYEYCLEYKISWISTEEQFNRLQVLSPKFQEAVKKGEITSIKQLENDVTALIDEIKANEKNPHILAQVSQIERDFLIEINKFEQQAKPSESKQIGSENGIKHTTPQLSEPLAEKQFLQDPDRVAALTRVAAGMPQNTQLISEGTTKTNHVPTMTRRVN